MAEKKGGFHDLEKRIHQIEDEDRAKEQQTSGGAEKKAPKQEPMEKQEAPRK